MFFSILFISQQFTAVDCRSKFLIDPPASEPLPLPITDYSSIIEELKSHRKEIKKLHQECSGRITIRISEEFHEYLEINLTLQFQDLRWNVTPTCAWHRVEESWRVF